MHSDVRRIREEMLRREVLAGDEQAWRILYEETFDDLYRYTLWRCGNRRDWADDVIQESWLVAVRRIRRFSPSEGAFLAWMCGIAANVLRNYLRKRRKIAELQESFKNVVEETSSRRPTQDHENEDRIASTLAALLDRHEAVLRAKYIDGLTVDEIAVNWNATPKTVESLLTRARQAFREIFLKFTGGK